MTREVLDNCVGMSARELADEVLRLHQSYGRALDSLDELIASLADAKDLLRADVSPAVTEEAA